MKTCTVKTCKKCGSARVAWINAKCSDCCAIGVGDCEHIGYVPGDCGIGGDDYVGFDYCLDCGQIQGEFPLPTTELERGGRGG